MVKHKELQDEATSIQDTLLLLKTNERHRDKIVRNDRRPFVLHPKPSENELPTMICMLNPLDPFTPMFSAVPSIGAPRDFPAYPRL
jgi:hypothetical protein